MGDRGNIIVKQGAGHEPVWLYAHDLGSELAAVLRRALNRRRRWNESPYLTRIIFCEMLAEYDATKALTGESGFGVSTWECDNEHDYLLVDPEAKTVEVVSRKDAARAGDDPLKARPRWIYSFEDFCQTTASSPDELHEENSST